ncbi:MAG: hypothetical protein V4543_17500 [Bacteroidota bacterium]
MKNSKYVLSLLFIYTCMLALPMLYGCATSTRVVSSWKAGETKLQAYNNVLVIGLMGAKDREIRESTENALVSALEAQGIHAVSSFKMYGPAQFGNPDDKNVDLKINRDGYDAAFAVSLLDKEKERDYAPGAMINTPYHGGYNNFWPYYNTMYSRVYTPDYYGSTTNYILEANFYILPKGELKYSAQTETFDPSSAKELAKEFTKAITDDMQKKGVVPGLAKK